MEFRFHRIRLTFAVAGIAGAHFPPGKAANVVRGALGGTLRSVCCPASCESARTCQARAACAYARIFEPVLSGGPSGFEDPPRPFVLRASHLDGRTFEPGETFAFDLHLFLVDDPPLDSLRRAFEQLADTGLGPARGLVRLDGMCSSLVRMKLEAASDERSEGCVVEFLTATELKHGGRVIIERPEFAVLIARVRDRLGSLSQLYGSDPLDFDWTGLVERARAVRLVEWDAGQTSDVTRYSTRTKQTHSIGGMTGTAVYRGPCTEFLPLLRAAEFTGVGRQTVWGKGWIRVNAT